MNNKYLNIFYNKNTLQDTLIAKIVTNKNPDKIINKNNVTIFYDENDQLIGFNIHNASERNLLLVNGLNEPNEKLIRKLEELTNLSLSKFINQIPFVIGKIISAEPIPNSNLKICTVDIGTNQLQKIVCGATNVVPNMNVVVVLPGGIIATGKEINSSKVLNHESHGMICSSKELDLPNEDLPKTIIKMPDDAIPGTFFTKVYSISK
ncbi:YtpR family tRNA-binding protein [Mycoplasmoides pirum]|uniref:YtpR family tRNA-binding protein n=1 Tax=Mycoplasmoides pirum TaxID=2122 RepID=UPI0005666C8E|nr:hypothetical protein [Mycoplasmoides pirum]